MSYRELKITRNDDRIQANLLVHLRIMDEKMAEGLDKTNASKFAMIDLRDIPMKDRIAEANAARKAETITDADSYYNTVVLTSVTCTCSIVGANQRLKGHTVQRDSWATSSA